MSIQCALPQRDAACLLIRRKESETRGGANRGLGIRKSLPEREAVHLQTVVVAPGLESALACRASCGRVVDARPHGYGGGLFFESRQNLPLGPGHVRRRLSRLRGGPAPRRDAP